MVGDRSFYAYQIAYNVLLVRTVRCARFHLRIPSRPTGAEMAARSSRHLRTISKRWRDRRSCARTQVPLRLIAEGVNVSEEILLESLFNIRGSRLARTRDRDSVDRAR